MNAAECVAELIGNELLAAFVIVAVLFAASAPLSFAARMLGDWCAGRAAGRAGIPLVEAVGFDGALPRLSRLLTKLVVLTGFTVAMMAFDPMSVGVAFVLAFLVAAMIESDVVYRYLPLELTVAAVVVGACLWLVDGAPRMFAIGSVVGVILLAAVEAVCVIGRRRGDRFAGGGDGPAMLALCCATGSGCLTGALAGCFFALGWGLIRRCLVRKGKLGLEGNAFPLAPFFGLWLMVGWLA